MYQTRRVKRLLFKRAAFPLEEMIPLLEDFFDTSVGQELLKQQQHLIDDNIETLFGYHLMQLGVTRQIDLYENSKVGHRFMLGPLRGENIVGVVDEEQLPIATEAIDVAILHHVLDYTQRPHQLLNEVARTIVPSGYMMVIGMNPFSFLGLWSLIGRFRRKNVWNNRLLALPRLADWLTLLGFSLESVQYGFYRVPLKKRKGGDCSWFEKMLNHFQWPFGGFYLVLAKKEVSTLTPIRPKRFRPAQSMIPVMEPSLYTPLEKRADKGQQSSGKLSPQKPVHDSNQ